MDGFFGCWLVDDVLLKQNFLGLTCRKIVVTLNVICWWKKHVFVQQNANRDKVFWGSTVIQGVTAVVHPNELGKNSGWLIYVGVDTTLL